MPNSAAFRYSIILNAHDESTLRPLIPIRLVNGEASIQANGLIDSGADVNVLPYELGITLGLAWGEQRYSLMLSGNLANFETLIFGQTNFFQTFGVCFFRAESYFTLTQ